MKPDLPSQALKYFAQRQSRIYVGAMQSAWPPAGRCQLHVNALILRFFQWLPGRKSLTPPNIGWPKASVATICLDADIAAICLLEPFSHHNKDPANPPMGILHFAQNSSDPREFQQMRWAHLLIHPGQSCSGSQPVLRPTVCSMYGSDVHAAVWILLPHRGGDTLQSCQSPGSDWFSGRSLSMVWEPHNPQLEANLLSYSLMR